MGWGKLRLLSQAFCFRADWSNRLLLLASSRRQGPTGLCQPKVALSGQDCRFVICYSRRSSWLCRPSGTAEQGHGTPVVCLLRSLLGRAQLLSSVFWASPSLPPVQGSGSALLRARSESTILLPPMQGSGSASSFPVQGSGLASLLYGGQGQSLCSLLRRDEGQPPFRCRDQGQPLFFLPWTNQGQSLFL